MGCVESDAHLRSNDAQSVSGDAWRPTIHVCWCAGVLVYWCTGVHTAVSSSHMRGILPNAAQLERHTTACSKGRDGVYVDRHEIAPTTGHSSDGMFCYRYPARMRGVFARRSGPTQCGTVTPLVKVCGIFPRHCCTTARKDTSSILVAWLHAPRALAGTTGKRKLQHVA